MTRAMRALTLVVLEMTGCAESAPRCPPVGYPKPTAAPKAQARGQQVHRANQSRETLQALLNAVGDLECGPGGLDPRAASAALSKLADTLPLRAGLPDPSAQRARQAAEAASQAANSTAADAIHRGLLAALQALLAKPGQVEYRGAVSRLGRSVAAMRAEQDAVSRCHSALIAFRAATDAVFVSLNGQPPFADPEPSTPSTQPLPSMQSGVALGRSAVASLGSAGWQHTRDDAGQALRLFASMLAAADCNHRLEKEISTVNFLAERLTRSDALAFGQTRWIKDALSAALDALEKLEANVSESAATHAAPNSAIAAASWTRAARQAVANVDPDNLLGLERTAIQDGFRATIDSFANAAESTPACHD